jgi:hypothetical protein
LTATTFCSRTQLYSDSRLRQGNIEQHIFRHVYRFSNAVRDKVGLASAPTCSCMHATILYVNHEPPGDVRVRTSASYMSIISPGTKPYKLMTQFILDTSHIQTLTTVHFAQRAAETSCIYPAETRARLNPGCVNSQSTRMVLGLWQDFDSDGY